MPRKKLKKAGETVKRIHEGEEGWAMNLSNYDTTKQAAETIGVGQEHIGKLMGRRKLKGIKLVHDWLVFAPSIENYQETKSPRDRATLACNSDTIDKVNRQG